MRDLATENADGYGRLLSSPVAPDARRYRVEVAGQVVLRFKTGGVNGHTADETAWRNLADFSEFSRHEGEHTLYRELKPVTDGRMGSLKLATAEHGCVKLVTS